MARKEKQQSDTPKKPGRFAQVGQVFTASRKADPTIPWWMLLAFVAVDGARGTRPEDVAGAAFVYRALGRPGIVLVGEGPDARRTKLLAQERKKVERVAPGVPVIAVVVGDGDDQVPVRKLSGKLTRMKPVLTKEEVSAVNKRLKSLGGLRPPVPAGMDPMRARVDRKAMRGR
jgi:hypothetical protein